MKIMICGSRNINDYEDLKRGLEMLPRPLETGDIVISGGARGVDTMAERCAEEHGLELMLFLADWQTYGKSAGFRRNVEMVDACDVVLAIWDGKSNGTAHSIDIARKKGKRVFFYVPGVFTAK